MFIPLVSSYILGGLLLFGIVQKLEKKQKLSPLFKILTPSLFLLLYSALVSLLHLDFLLEQNDLLVVCYFVMVYVYEKYILKKGIRFDHKEFAVEMICSFSLCFIIYQSYISQVDKILPQANEIKAELWALVLLFTFYLLKDRVTLPKLKEETKEINKREYVVMEYARRKNQFSKVVTNPIKQDFFKDLVYAIMIYENSITPTLFRYFTSIKRKITKKSYPSGIMQIKSKKELSDEKSIELAISKLEKIYGKENSSKKKIKEDELIKRMVEEYTKEKEKQEAILSIYRIISDFEKNK